MVSAATLTPGLAASDLLGELRGLLERHGDDVETVEELREIADELTRVVRRTRGRITRLAKREPKPEPEAAAAKPVEAPAAQARPSERAPEVTARVAPKPSEGRPEPQPAARPLKPSAPGSPAMAEVERSRWAWLAAVLTAALIVVGVIGAAATTVGASVARWTVHAVRACRAAAGKVRIWTRRRWREARGGDG